VKVSNDFGIIIRKKAIVDRGIYYKDLLVLMECVAPFDESDELLSFGPHFGGEAANEFIHRLKQVGLVYVDDFIDFHTPLPEWCNVWMSIKS